MLCNCPQLWSRVRLFVTPRTVVRQAPLFRGFSRKEYWNGLPFPPPGDLPDPGNEPTSALVVDSLPLSHLGRPSQQLHTTIYIKLESESEVTQSCPTLCDFIDCSLPGSSVHEDSLGKNTGVGCHALQGNLPNPGIKPRSPALQADSLLSEPPGKPIALALIKNCSTIQLWVYLWTLFCPIGLYI